MWNLDAVRVLRTRVQNLDEGPAASSWPAPWLCSLDHPTLTVRSPYEHGLSRPARAAATT